MNILRRASLNTISVAVIDNYIYSLLKKRETLLLSVINTDLEVVKTIWSTIGKVGFILKVEKNRVLISSDDKLYLIKDGEAEIVLTASDRRNMFWHLAEAEQKVFVQEYGQPPTAIYASKDFENWERVVTNLDVDKRSKHFHDIAFDSCRKQLIATLGDGCIMRVVYSEDLETWRPLYRGPWQFVPIVCLEDRLVFGMDSGIVKGGIGIYHPTEGRWEFLFLKWRERRVNSAQMIDLKHLDNGLWIAALGTPQAIVASKDLKTWYTLYVEGFDEQFNHVMGISEGDDFVVCCTGKSILLFNKEELENLNAEPSMVHYKAYKERLIGVGFSLKHRLKLLKEGILHT